MSLRSITHSMKRVCQSLDKPIKCLNDEMLDALVNGDLNSIQILRKNPNAHQDILDKKYSDCDRAQFNLYSQSILHLEMSKKSAENAYLDNFNTLATHYKMIYERFSQSLRSGESNEMTLLDHELKPVLSISYTCHPKDEFIPKKVELAGKVLYILLNSAYTKRNIKKEAERTVDMIQSARKLETTHGSINPALYPNLTLGQISSLKIKERYNALRKKGGSRTSHIRHKSMKTRRVKRAL